ncbi:MAG: hypothetical protein WC551_11900 [Patescibacteria group bacterium]
MKKPKAKRLVRGRDWHGWAYQFKDGSLGYWASITSFQEKMDRNGKWVRVKFVEAPEE